MQLISTRGGGKPVSPAEAIAKGIAEDGGLYVPQSFPALTADELEKLLPLEYYERAAYIIGKYLTDFTGEELLEYCKAAYERFDGEPAPLANLQENTYMLELWHGPTCAFKDIALTLLPHLLAASRKKIGSKLRTLILVATSGDTGKAALEGFKDVEDTAIIVFYPNDGVSKMQQLQMSTQNGSNTHVIAVDGNFDDTQNGVKTIFNSREANKKINALGYELSSANSINFGRLVPQIAYYVSAYLDLVSGGEIEMGDKINFCVPSGNFGNILAGYYSYRMGLPVNKLICASNTNKVLCDFITTGEYNTGREFYKTMSPSMDILISSNLERYLFELCGRDSSLLSDWMKELKEDGNYRITPEQLNNMRKLFASGWADETETAEAIRNCQYQSNYVADPHTAVGSYVYSTYVTDTGDGSPAVIVSTASPYKFAQDVYRALEDKEEPDAFKVMQKLKKWTGYDAPEAISGLAGKEILHNETCKKSEMTDRVIEWIKR